MVAALNFSGREQLYYQLYDILFQDIVNGVYAVGDLIPSESELMRAYGVSRATARRAMEMLVQNGLITKKRGHGSTVIANQPNTSPRRVTSYIRKNTVDRVAPVKRVVDAQIVPASGEVALALGIAAETPTFRLRRVRYAGEEPFYLETNHVEATFAPDALEHDFSTESLRAYLTTSRRAAWSHAQQAIYSVVADADLAGLLHVEEGSPLLYIRRISYDKSGIPREYVMTYYRGDLYHLEIELGI